MTAVCMIYGATGFAGRLILDTALARGLRPIIGGRSEAKVRALAAGHQLPFRAFTLDDPAAVADALKDVDVVLNAAGPFADTAEPLAHVCIAEGVHYLDIGCERQVLQRFDVLNDVAREAGVSLLPGVGFCPSVGEALAVHLNRRLPDAVRLVIALSAPLPPSAGLIRAGHRIALRPARAVRRGRLKTLRRRRMRRFDFGIGAVRCYALDWGELAVIPRATGIRNVDFFVQERPDLRRLLDPLSLIAGFRPLPFVRKRLEADARRHAGPSPARRSRCRSRLAGFAYDPSGQRAATRLHLPDPYTVTAALAVMALERVSSDLSRTGLHTATQYLGADFLAGLPGLPVDWEELELSAPGEVRLHIRKHVPLVQRLRPGRQKHKPSADGVSPGPGRADGALSPARPAAPGPETRIAAAAPGKMTPAPAAGHRSPAEAFSAEPESENTESVRRTGTG